MLELHLICLALEEALLRAGRSIAARIAIMAMTTSNSISVKALYWRQYFGLALQERRLRLGYIL